MIDDVLFLCELKNHVLPEASSERKYHFLGDMAEAGHQIDRITQAIQADPTIIISMLGDVKWTRIERIVLNSMPWAFATDDSDVTFYDYSAFARLLDSPYLHLKTTAAPDNRQLVIAQRVRKLWSEDKFSANDLIRELGDPFQVRALATAYKLNEHVLPLARRFYLRGFTLVPEPQDLSSQLEAMGIQAGERTVSALTRMISELRHTEPEEQG